MTRTLTALLIAAGLTLVPAPAHAGDLTEVQVTPVHCGPVYCWQRKVVTTHVHGRGTTVATYGHRRPVESRSTFTVPPFTRYALRGVVFLPVQ